MVKTIKLERPVQWHGAQVSEIALKEPSGQQFIDFGEPRVVVSNRAGSVTWMEIPETIKAYFDRCIDHEGGSALLAQMSLTDAQKIKQALFDFFLAA